ncbi:alpha/beta hydrolase [Paenibacillus hexagrammi]|uniref:Esterase n=1 Tax=Paenibacillus hexagrammi TaxID=2908839 RepID=A0ABY3SEA0_9BACL|nr:alpha/beta hydrolase-fold protein [Paenibacillus sp. YPD9-1]UJF31738.1 esterase [Paenibacillus sp. YPD9-1]
MENMDMTALPPEYKQLAKEGHRGEIHQVTYKVRHYLNASRQLVTSGNVEAAEAGREPVEGEAILKTCSVYLPAGYDPHDIETKYNVLYLLHGVGGDHDEWLDSNGKVDGSFVLCNIVDNLIANGHIDPLIIVFPNGRSAHDWTDRSFNPMGTNILGFYYFDYELRYDLIPFIESTYHTRANIQDRSPEGIEKSRMHRAIAGLSMGGMQALNLILGGDRCDSTAYTGRESGWANGLDPTVRASGMEDLFAYIGAFSNAPTSSGGSVLGAGIASKMHQLHVLYMICGDADEVSIGSFESSTDGLAEAAGAYLADFYQVIVKHGVHDFHVWNNGVYQFLLLSCRRRELHVRPNVIRLTIV